MSGEVIATDIPDPEALAREVARLRGILRDLLTFLGTSGVSPAMMEHFKHRLAEPDYERREA